MVSSLLSLLSLLVDRAFHTRADLPPCPVPLTGRRYGFPSGNQSPGSLRSTSLSMAPELMATSFDSGSHWPSLSPSARATLADPRFGILSRVLRPLLLVLRLPLVSPPAASPICAPSSPRHVFLLPTRAPSSPRYLLSPPAASPRCVLPICAPSSPRHLLSLPTLAPSSPRHVFPLPIRAPSSPRHLLPLMSPVLVHGTFILHSASHIPPWPRSPASVLLPPPTVPSSPILSCLPLASASTLARDRLLFSRPRRGLVRRRLRCQPWPVHHQPRLIRRLSRARLMHCWPRLMRSRPLRCGRPVRLRCGLRRRFCPRPHRCHRRGLGRHRCRWLRHQLVRHPPRPRLQR